MHVCVLVLALCNKYVKHSHKTIKSRLFCNRTFKTFSPFKRVFLHYIHITTHDEKKNAVKKDKLRQIFVCISIYETQRI